MILFIGGVLYLILLDTNVQPWAKIYEEDTNTIENAKKDEELLETRF